MGKKNYTKTDISKSKTDELGIESLLVIDSESDDNCYHVLHERYFSNEKCMCPACHSKRTRTSKGNVRKFKDVIMGENDRDFTVIDLLFHQRYFRCDECKSSVFPEDIYFAQKGSRYTNRLSNKLADGTLKYSYKKVCAFYGVPASTASVGYIMRRQFKNRESQFPPFETPATIAIIELNYFRKTYPLILGIRDDGIFCMDILKDGTEASYSTFFRTLDSSKVKNIFIEPNEELRNAAAYCLPTSFPLISKECIYRHGRNALIEIIRSDGKRFPIVHKEDMLTQNKKFLNSDRDKNQIKQGMSCRPRLKKAYNHYQSLLGVLEGPLDYSQLLDWAYNNPTDVWEFTNLSDIIEFYENEIQAAIRETDCLPDNFSAVVQGVCDAIKAMPYCIFDVLRARCLLTSAHDTIKENEIVKRLGIPVERFISNINEITQNIKEEKEYELE